MIDIRSSIIPVIMTLVGCVTVHSSMMRSANNLELSANAFAVDEGHHFPHATEFASRAHYFLETVDHAGDREVISAYEHLWDAYHALRDEVERSGSQRAEFDFKSLTQAFTYVARDIRGYADADSSIYARGGFQHDPYYDP
jgi:hypothetical protein